LFENWENHVVPSVLVLVLGNDAALSSVADAAVAGAKRIRFTEVAVRALKPAVFRYRVLDADESLAAYDGVVFVGPIDGPTATNIQASHAADLTNVVMSHTGGANTELDTTLVSLGGIVVSASAKASKSSLEDHAGAVGERVAKVAGWVRHALGHETEHGHHHHHQHSEHHHRDHAQHDDHQHRH
jgi:hypothetical protein